jgi:hypothetical protein
MAHRLGMIVLLQYTLIANFMICASCTGISKREIESCKREECLSAASVFLNFSTWQCTRISLVRLDHSVINALYVFMCVSLHWRAQSFACTVFMWFLLLCSAFHLFTSILKGEKKALT